MSEAVERAQQFQPAPLADLSTCLDPYRAQYTEPEELQPAGDAALELSPEREAELARVYE